jgi:hypothetical protein
LFNYRADRLPQIRWGLLDQSGVWLQQIDWHGGAKNRQSVATHKQGLGIGCALVDREYGASGHRLSGSEQI